MEDFLFEDSRGTLNLWLVFCLGYNLGLYWEVSRRGAEKRRNIVMVIMLAKDGMEDEF
jgi:hypothetical protein